MPFRYYLTFIDETEVGSDGGSSQIRAKSLPPLTVSQQEEEQDVLQQLVAALPERAAHLHLGIFREVIRRLPSEQRMSLAMHGLRV